MSELSEGWAHSIARGTDKKVEYLGTFPFPGGDIHLFKQADSNVIFVANRLDVTPEESPILLVAAGKKLLELADSFRRMFESAGLVGVRAEPVILLGGEIEQWRIVLPLLKAYGVEVVELDELSKITAAASTTLTA